MKAFESGFCGCFGVCGAIIAIIIGCFVISALMAGATVSAHPGPDNWESGEPNACFAYHRWDDNDDGVIDDNDTLWGHSWHCHTDAEWDRGYWAMRPEQGYPNGTAGAPGHAPSAYRSIGGELQINTGTSERQDWCPVGQSCE